MEDIPKQELEILDFWEKNKIYKFNSKTKKPIYSVDTPPPTVSGKMHIGHAFSYAQQDFAVRFKRMQGWNVFYPFGTDDNGLPTERLVEKSKNVKARDMPREAFIKLCLDYLKTELPKFIFDWKRIGISSDFDIYYSTINSHSRKISQWSFLDLYKKNRLERRNAPAMFCTECQTGVSQVEAKDKLIDSEFNHIVFKVSKSNDFDDDQKYNRNKNISDIDNKDLVIATTRPELLPACVAIFFHPDDSRFRHLKNKKALVPLFNFEVPILEDKLVELEKGTGIVMCCTFGDQTDMEWQKAHKLPIKQALTSSGTFTKIAGKYAGLTIYEARKTIIEDLKKQGLLKKQEKIKHPVNVHERCDTELEFLVSKQWFVKYLDLKKQMLSWGNKLNWHPKHMKHRYDNWVKGLQWDWLISNQRYFGVPFPVWYCEKCGNAILATPSQLPVDPLKDKPLTKCKCGSDKFVPEKDILNTWFTSSMTPQIAIQLMPKNIQNKLFPMTLRPQAHDIITFWLFNTVVKSNLHYKKNPFKDVIISGFVTLKGEKMSKSKGNIIEPQAVTEKYGADALRYWAASSKLGEDLDYQEEQVLAGKKFITKILNATKFVFMNLKNYNPKPTKLLETDKIFLGKLNETIQASTKAFESYEYSKAKQEADNFFWKIFTDNYLELVKHRVYNGNKQEKTSAFYTLYQMLLTILKLFAPFTPFITERLYQDYFKKHEKTPSIHLSSYPQAGKLPTKQELEKLNLLLDIISKARQAKSEAKKSMKTELELTLPATQHKILKSMIPDLQAVTNAKQIKTGKFKIEILNQNQ